MHFEYTHIYIYIRVVFASQENFVDYIALKNVVIAKVSIYWSLGEAMHETTWLIVRSSHPDIMGIPNLKNTLN